MDFFFLVADPQPGFAWSSLLLNKIRTLLLTRSYENLLDCCSSRRRVGACELVCCCPLNVIKIITSKKSLVISFVVYSWCCQSELRFCQTMAIPIRPVPSKICHSNLVFYFPELVKFLVTVSEHFFKIETIRWSVQSSMTNAR